MKRPINNLIIIKPVDAADNKDGIFIPSKVSENEGTVTAISDGIALPCPLMEGDIVTHLPNKGTKLVVEDIEYLVIDIEHITTYDRD